MLDKVKLLLGLTSNDKDNLLLVLIEQAIDEAIDYTHNDKVCDYDNAIIKMVVYNYNRLGSEGLDSEGYSGVSYNYTADYPDSILRVLKAHRKLQTL